MRTHWEASRSPLEVMPKPSEPGNSSTMSPLIATHFRCCKSKQAHGKPASNGTHREPNGNPLGTHWEPTGNPLGIHRVAGTHWELMGSENYWQPACKNQGNPQKSNGNPLGTHWEPIGNPLGTHAKCCKNQGTHWEPMHGESESAQW